jgi:hypothetical protein
LIRPTGRVRRDALPNGDHQSSPLVRQKLVAREVRASRLLSQHSLVLETTWDGPASAAERACTTHTYFGPVIPTWRPTCTIRKMICPVADGRPIDPTIPASIYSSDKTPLPVRYSCRALFWTSQFLLDWLHARYVAEEAWLLMIRDAVKAGLGTAERVQARRSCKCLDQQSCSRRAPVDKCGTGPRLVPR